MKISHSGRCRKPISSLPVTGKMTNDISQAITWEQNLPPGSYRVQFDLTEPADITTIKNTLENNGVAAYVKQWKSGDIWHLGISYAKPATEGISFLPMAIIPMIAFAVTATLVGISIFKISDITTSLTKLIITVGVVAVAVLYMSKKPAR